MHTVGIGQADFCWSQAWLTAERMKMSTFSPVFSGDEVVLLVNATYESSNDFWTAFKKPFSPFTPALWALIFVSFGFVGITLTYENRPQETKVNWWDFFFAEAPLGALKGFFAYTTGGDITSGIEFHTSGSWVTAFFMGFSAFVLMTGYGAVVTTTLITQQQQVKISSLDVVVNQRLTICTYAQLKITMMNRDPRLEQLLRGVPTSDLLDAMDRGECDVALITKNHWNVVRMFYQDKHCQGGAAPKIALPNVLHTLTIHIPVRTELLGALSYLLTMAVETGMYEQLAEEARANYTFGLCSELDFDDSEVAKFGLASLAGPLVLLMAFGMMSMIVTRIGRFMYKTEQVVKDQLDADHDGKVSVGELVVAVDHAAHTAAHAIDHAAHSAEHVVDGVLRRSKAKAPKSLRGKPEKDDKQGGARSDPPTDTTEAHKAELELEVQARLAGGVISPASQARLLQQLTATVQELSASIEEVKVQLAEPHGGTMATAGEAKAAEATESPEKEAERAEPPETKRQGKPRSGGEGQRAAQEGAGSRGAAAPR